MAELKEGWNGPMKLTVKASYPKGLAADGSGTQWKGKYPPHKDVLQWDTLFEETGATKITVCSAKQPAVGTVYEEAHIEISPNANKPEYPFRNMFTKDEKASKAAGGAGFPSGGGSKGPMYTPEQWTQFMNARAVELAILQLTTFAGENAGKVTKEVTLQVATSFADFIKNHGKAATPPQA